MSETISSKKVKARKEHKCEWCCGTISVGEIYERQSIIDDGSVYTWKNHLSCSELASNLKWFDDCDEGLSFEDFKTNVNEVHSDLMSKEQIELYESEDYLMPSFQEKLQFLKDKYLP